MKLMASLAVTNKHLSSASKRREAVRLTVATSSAIEGIRVQSKGKKAGGTVKRVAKTKVAGVTGARRAKSA